MNEKPRMVIAKFLNNENNFKLFKHRNVLRNKGIIISNDLLAASTGEAS